MIRDDFMPGGRLYFSPGRIVLDRRSLKHLSSDDVISGVSRHIFGDWGIVSRRQRKTNQRAILERKPLCSVYLSTDGLRFSLVTNSERSHTTVKLL